MRQPSGQDRDMQKCSRAHAPVAREPALKQPVIAAARDAPLATGGAAIAPPDPQQLRRHSSHGSFQLPLVLDVQVSPRDQ